MIRMNKKDNEFWITNMSAMNVSLADLNLTVKAYSSINLMDKKHYYYTIEQLNKSAKSGSIFKKRNKIAVRKVSPIIPDNTIIEINKEASIPGRERSLLKISYEKYEELEILDDQKVSDEKFAAENADLANIDAQQQIISKGSYVK